jgi:protein-disulfide isomerase
MQVSRRVLLALVPTLALPATARAAEDARFAERAIGAADAPVTAIEFYSLTCSHCAAFARETMPRVKADLIETGKLRIIYWDFPLDQVSLTATMVARSLPPERYVAFTSALLATQDRWAFARNVNSTDELARMAALAGMPRESFNRAIADTELRTWILTRQDEGQKKYGVDSTPSFVLNGPGAHDRREAGALGFDAFARVVAQAAG